MAWFLLQDSVSADSGCIFCTCVLLTDYFVYFCGKFVFKKFTACKCYFWNTFRANFVLIHWHILFHFLTLFSGYVQLSDNTVQLYIYYWQFFLTTIASNLFQLRVSTISCTDLISSSWQWHCIWYQTDLDRRLGALSFSLALFSRHYCCEQRVIQIALIFDVVSWHSMQDWFHVKRKWVVQHATFIVSTS